MECCIHYAFPTIFPEATPYVDTVPALRHGLTQPLTMTGMLRGLTGVPTKVLGSIPKADVGAFALRM